MVRRKRRYRRGQPSGGDNHPTRPAFVGSAAMAADDITGMWSPVLSWPGPAVHTHVLPTGEVLFWPFNEGGIRTPTYGPRYIPTP